jgi:hypothetical protein
MPDLKRARKRIADLVKGMRDPGVIHKHDGSTERMTPIQLKVMNAYARQFERVVLDDLQD